LHCYTKKDIKISFAIICPDNSLSLLRTTVGSISQKYQNVPFICVTSNSANADEIASMKKMCPTYKGKSTITSLINVAYRHAPTEWLILIFAGTAVQGRLDEKFGFFIGSEKDILYPIANNKTNFIDATLNGLMINKKLFKDIGPFLEDDELEFVKSEWACRAIENGCKFKAVIGCKMC
jgi:hypothetical protein